MHANTAIMMMVMAQPSAYQILLRLRSTRKKKIHQNCVHSSVEFEKFMAERVHRAQIKRRDKMQERA